VCIGCSLSVHNARQRTFENVVRGINVFPICLQDALECILQNMFSLECVLSKMCSLQNVLGNGRLRMWYEVSCAEFCPTKRSDPIKSKNCNRLSRTAPPSSTVSLSTATQCERELLWFMSVLRVKRDSTAAARCTTSAAHFNSCLRGSRRHTEWR